MMNDLINILKYINPEYDYSRETGLVKEKKLSSLELIMLITEITEAFDIEISPEMITPENFDSAETIYALIESIRDGE